MIEHASPAMLRATIEALADDLPARAIKIGMLGRESTIGEVGKCLLRVEGAPKVVCDPVMFTTSGARLLDEACCAKVVRDIFPHCALITPNLHEAEALVGRRLGTAQRDRDVAQVERQRVFAPQPKLCRGLLAELGV